MKKGHVSPSVPAETHLRRELLDPQLAADYLSYAAESDDPLDFMLALRAVAEAYGGIGGIARRARLSRQQLYKTLSVNGNPELRTLRAILDATGFSLSVVPHKRTGKRAGVSGRRKSLPRARQATQNPVL